MAATRRCPTCHAEFSPEELVAGSCPACLMKLALANRGSRGQAPPATPPQRIGPYNLLTRLGEGGMGEVFLAEQDPPLRRRVAIKIIKTGMASREVLARFDLERQALALMDHPGIAAVLDAGATPDGRPYFAMEYVDGVPITEYCTRHGLDTRRRVKLFLQVCAAVQHAHQKGIIHRDLKPSNVLVTEVDGQPVPKVIDFGIAKATAQHLAEQTLFTQLGMLVGTPEYMSPEQADLRGVDIDTRTDIYALGVILYEMLTGALPFDATALRAAGLAEMHRVIREEEPPRPSLRVTTARRAGAGGTPSTVLAHELRGDLDWITLKALEKDRARRYASASEMGADVERYLADEPVVASPPSAGYRLGKTLRRHRAAVLAVAAVLVTLAGGLAVATTMYKRAEAARVEAEHQRQAADRKSYVATLTAADLLIRNSQTAEARTRLAQVPPGSRGWEWRYLFTESDSSLAALGSGGGAVISLEFTPDGSRLVWVGDLGVLRGADAATFQPDERMRRPIDVGDRPESVVAVTRDGTRYLSMPWVVPVHGVMHLRVTGKPEGREPTPADVPNMRIYVSARMVQGYSAASGPLSGPPALPVAERTLSLQPLGRDATTTHIVLPALGVSGPIAPSITILDPRIPGKERHLGFFIVDRYPHDIRNESGRALATFSGRQGSVLSAAFSADGRRVVTWSWDNVLMVWDSTSGALVARLAGHRDGITRVAVDRTGSRVASASHDGTIRLWSVGSAGGPRVMAGHDGSVLSVAISADGSQVASGGADRTARLWTLDGQPAGILKGHTGEVTAVAFSPDGRRVATGSADQTIRVWDAGTSRSVGELRGHTAEVTALTFNPDGSRIASGSADGTVRVWDARRLRFVPPDPALPAAMQTGGVPDGTVDLDPGTGRVVAGAPGPAVLSWSLDAPERFAIMGETRRSGRGSPSQEVTTDLVVVAPGGRRAVSRTNEGRVTLWSLDTAKAEADLAPAGTANTGLTFSPDGARVALISSKDRTITVRPIGAGPSLVIHTGPVLWEGPQFSADGRVLGTQAPHAVAIWDAARGTLIREIRVVDAEVMAFRLSPDASRIVVGSVNGWIRVFEVASGATLATRAAEGPGIAWPLAFDRTGSRLVTADEQGRVRVWDPSSLDLLLQLDLDARSSSRASFTPDGNELVLLADDGTAVRFDARRAQETTVREVVHLRAGAHELSGDARAALHGDRSLAEPVREEALRRVAALGDDPVALADNALFLARNPGQRPEDYQRAVRLAEAAVREVPQNARYVDYLGLALYRVARYREAVAAFRRAEALRGGPDLPGLIFLPLAFDRLGEHAQAKAAANRIDTYMDSRDQGSWSTFEEDWWVEYQEAAKASAGPAAGRR